MMFRKHLSALFCLLFCLGWPVFAFSDYRDDPLTPKPDPGYKDDSSLTKGEGVGSGNVTNDLATVVDYLDTFANVFIPTITQGRYARMRVEDIDTLGVSWSRYFTSAFFNTSGQQINPSQQSSYLYWLKKAVTGDSLPGAGWDIVRTLWGIYDYMYSNDLARAVSSIGVSVSNVNDSVLLGSSNIVSAISDLASGNTNLVSAVESGSTNIVAAIEAGVDRVVQGLDAVTNSLSSLTGTSESLSDLASSVSSILTALDDSNSTLGLFYLALASQRDDSWMVTLTSESLEELEEAIGRAIADNSDISSSLESFGENYLSSIVDIDRIFSDIQALLETQNLDLDAIIEILTALNTRQSNWEYWRVNSLDPRLSLFEGYLYTANQTLSTMDTRVSHIDGDLHSISSGLDAIRDDVSDIANDSYSSRQSLYSIDTTLTRVLSQLTLADSTPGAPAAPQDVVDHEAESTADSIQEDVESELDDYSGSDYDLPEFTFSGMIPGDISPLEALQPNWDVPNFEDSSRIPILSEPLQAGNVEIPAMVLDVSSPSSVYKTAVLPFSTQIGSVTAQLWDLIFAISCFMLARYEWKQYMSGISPVLAAEDARSKQDYDGFAF